MPLPFGPSLKMDFNALCLFYFLRELLKYQAQLWIEEIRSRFQVLQNYLLLWRRIPVRLQELAYSGHHRLLDTFPSLLYPIFTLKPSFHSIGLRFLSQTLHQWLALFALALFPLHIIEVNKFYRLRRFLLKLFLLDDRYHPLLPSCL